MITREEFAAVLTGPRMLQAKSRNTALGVCMDIFTDGGNSRR